jgi:hypothetical protein
MISKARLLCERTGYGLPREFSETVLTQTYEDNPEALRLSLLPSRYVMRRLRDSVRRDIETILECLEGVLVAEKADESLNWKSPWSTSRSGIPSA